MKAEEVRMCLLEVIVGESSEVGCFLPSKFAALDCQIGFSASILAPISSHCRLSHGKESSQG